MKNKIYLCSPKEFKGAISLPMIEFTRLKKSIDLSDVDTILFTSKQAIIYLDEISNEWQNKKILAVGSATAKMAKELGATDIYHPKEFYGEVLASDILEKFRDRKIVYIRPKVVSFDSKAFLSNKGIDIKEEILYETTCKEHSGKELEEGAVIIFTSPSTIECFFKSFSWDSSYKAVVIGKSTLKNLPKNVTAFVSEEATIDSCVKKAKEIV